MSQSFVASRVIGGDTYQIDTDPARLNIGLIHHFLSECSHWARGVPLETVQRAIAHSLPFGLYRGERQIGFARVVTDHATFAYLADVFVLPERRHAGLGQWLVETILDDPRLQGLRRWLLVTRDAQTLYARCGFGDPTPNCHYMERLDPLIYVGNAREAASA